MANVPKEIRRARVAMQFDAPFFGYLALTLEPIERPDLEPKTMGTDGIHLYYHPDFIKNTPITELQGVIAHEIGHIILKHLARRQRREPKRWNVACVTGDTLITLADGSEKPITEINEGDQVIGANGYGTVLLKISRLSDKIVEVSSARDKLSCTTEHLILTPSGFREAGDLNEKTVYRLAIGGKRVCLTKLSSNGYQEDGRTFTKNLSLGRRFLVTPPANGTTFYRETSVKARTNGVTVGVPSRNRGWRGYNYDYQTQPVSSPQYPGLQYKLCSDGNDGKLGVLEDSDKEYARCSCLAYSTGGLADRTYIAEVITIPNNQKRAMRTGTPVFESETMFSQFFDPRNAGYSPENQGLEQTRVSVRARTGEACKVFDLVTTCHSYIANGFVVHNCDYAINPLVLKDKFELPAGALVDSQYYDKSAEWIYSNLPVTKDSSAGSGTLDSHEEWKNWGKGQGSGGGDDQSSPIDSAEALEQEWQNRVAMAATQARVRGKFPAHMEQVVGELLQPKLDWKALLRDRITSCAKNDYRLVPANKKHLYRGFVLPSIAGEEINIAVGVDDSGSISDEEIRLFLSEVKGICDAYDEYAIHLFIADAAIHQRFELHAFDPMPNVVVGRGGTDFRPVITEAEKLDISSLVYFTDLYGSFPDKEPRIPVIWVCTTDLKPPWGSLIPFPRENNRRYK